MLCLIIDFRYPPGKEIPVFEEADTHDSERYRQCRIGSCAGQVQRTSSAGGDDQLQRYRHTPRQFTL